MSFLDTIKDKFAKKEVPPPVVSRPLIDSNRNLQRNYGNYNEEFNRKDENEFRENEFHGSERFQQRQPEPVRGRSFEHEIPRFNDPEPSLPRKNFSRSREHDQDEVVLILDRISRQNEMIIDLLKEISFNLRYHKRF